MRSLRNRRCSSGSRNSRRFPETRRVCATIRGLQTVLNTESDHRSAMANIIFMGTPDFSVPILEALIRNHTVTAVVTQPDRPAGRGREVQQSPIKQVALANKIPVLQPEKIGRKAAMEELQRYEAEAYVVALAEHRNGGHQHRERRAARDAAVGRNGREVGWRGSSARRTGPPAPAEPADA